MLAEIEKRLLLTNLAVFVSVIGALSIAVYAYFIDSLYSQVRGELSKLADSTISSIDFDTHAVDDSGKPDLIVSALPDSASQSLMAINLQWFEPNGRLSAQKGNFTVNMPLSPEAAFQTQTNPHALLLTKRALMNGRTLGFVRVAHPLEEIDELVGKLTMGLLLGLLIGGGATATGINILVRQSMRPIEKSVKRLKQFTADASHEFSSPVMAIKSNSEVALKYSDGMRPKDREKFQLILDASDQLIRLSSDLLELAQLDEAEPVQKKFEADLCDVLREIVASLSDDELSKVTTSLPPSLFVAARSEHLFRICSNIISNALFYTPHGGSIHITVTATPLAAIVTVKDSGIGIEAKDLDRIFDRFWRADKARSRRASGQGLGLSIAKALVEQYKGEILVESTLGKGSTFRVTFPRT